MALGLGASIYTAGIRTSSVLGVIELDPGPADHRLTGRSSLGLGSLELLTNLLEGPVHHTVGREQPLAAGQKLLDLGLSDPPAPSQLLRHPGTGGLGLLQHPARLDLRARRQGPGILLGLCDR